MKIAYNWLNYWFYLTSKRGPFGNVQENKKKYKSVKLIYLTDGRR